MTERRRGRPRIGDKVEVRLPPETILRIDNEARRRVMHRAELLREAIELYVASLDS